MINLFKNVFCVIVKTRRKGGPEMLHDQDEDNRMMSLWNWQTISLSHQLFQDNLTGYASWGWQTVTSRSSSSSTPSFNKVQRTLTASSIKGRYRAIPWGRGMVGWGENQYTRSTRFGVNDCWQLNEDYHIKALNMSKFVSWSPRIKLIVTVCY